MQVLATGISGNTFLVDSVEFTNSVVSIRMKPGNYYFELADISIPYCPGAFCSTCRFESMCEDSLAIFESEFPNIFTEHPEYFI